jgi:lipoprotein-anchoring transpeptidase ErfK/SrfK
MTRSRVLLIIAVVVTLGLGAGWILWPRDEPAAEKAVWSPPAATSTPSVAPSTPAAIPVAAKAPAGLPVITYTHVPTGFPDDPEQTSAAALTEGLHATKKLPLYDKPGGKPLAFLPPTIRGVTVVVPIVKRQPGWVAVLLPSVNRRVGWLPGTGWESRELRDQLVVKLATHELTWLRDGVRKDSWTVAIGTKKTPTPLGRTFVLGRTGTHGSVYAGLDAIVLGAVPDDRDAVAPGLQNAHTGIHSWYSKSVFGHNVSNGCVRVPQPGQRDLLENIHAGTPVVVLA